MGGWEQILPPLARGESHLGTCGRDPSLEGEGGGTSPSPSPRQSRVLLRRTVKGEDKKGESRGVSPLAGVCGCRRSTCHCEVSEGLLRVASGDTDSPLARAAATKQSLKDANEDCFAEPVLSAVRFFASAQNESKRRARNNTNTLLDKAV